MGAITETEKRTASHKAKKLAKKTSPDLNERQQIKIDDHTSIWPLKSKVEEFGEDYLKEKFYVANESYRPPEK